MTVFSPDAPHPIPPHKGEGAAWGKHPRVPVEVCPNLQAPPSPLWGGMGWGPRNGDRKAPRNPQLPTDRAAADPPKPPRLATAARLIGG